LVEEDYPEVIELGTSIWAVRISKYSLILVKEHEVRAERMVHVLGGRGQFLHLEWMRGFK
jgi:hypothetical protein